MPRAVRSISRPEGLRVRRAAVGHHAHLAAGLLVAAPRAHHEGVVDGHAPDLVDALGQEAVVRRDVARHVLGRARRGERARKPEDDDAPALGQIRHLEVVGADAAARGFLLVELREVAFRQTISDPDRTSASLRVMERAGRRAPTEHAAQGTIAPRRRPAAPARIPGARRERRIGGGRSAWARAPGGTCRVGSRRDDHPAAHHTDFRGRRPGAPGPGRSASRQGRPRPGADGRGAPPRRPRRVLHEQPGRRRRARAPSRWKAWR